MSFTNRLDFPMILGMNRFFSPLIVLGSLLVSLSMAAPLRTTETALSGQARTPEVYPDLSAKTWWLFAGLDLGGISYSSINLPTEGARSGFSFGGRLLVSRHSGSFVMDGGLGWKWISASGVNPNNTTDKISSRLPFLDLSVRYRISDRFQIGPEFEFWLGTDNGLNENPTSNESNQGKFLGVQAVYEWDRHRKYRVGGKVMTGLGVPGRTVTQYLAFYQLSFDVFGEKIEPVQNRAVEQVTASDLERADSLTPREPIPMTTKDSASASNQSLGYSEPAEDVMSTPAPPEENIEPEATPAPVSSPESRDPGRKPVFSKKLVLTLGTNDLPFGQSDSKLPLAHQARVRNIGKYLLKNQTAWNRLEVSAHTDGRGDAKKNKKISLKRAELIRKILMEGGVSGKRIKAYGLGATRPISRGNNEKAWSRNQRVELEFTDVKDSALIRKALEQ